MQNFINISFLRRDLKKIRNPQKAKILSRFFKTGKGEYGEGDIFWGITVPLGRTIAKKYSNLTFAQIQELLVSKVHEQRSIALFILVYKYKKEDILGKEKIADFYLKNTENINNWDLVDSSAPYILGDYFFDKEKKTIYKLAFSQNVWERRIAVLTTFGFIRKGSFQDALKIYEVLLKDKHDLIQKAVGWMLREIGKRDLAVELKFLSKHYKNISRTTLRYAIERFDLVRRKHYLLLSRF